MAEFSFPRKGYYDGFLVPVLPVELRSERIRLRLPRPLRGAGAGRGGTLSLILLLWRLVEAAAGGDLRLTACPGLPFQAGFLFCRTW